MYRFDVNLRYFAKS
nr:unnamed protein product [Callosobruchus analis]